MMMDSPVNGTAARRAARRMSSSSAVSLAATRARQRGYTLPAARPPQSRCSSRPTDAVPDRDPR